GSPRPEISAIASIDADGFREKLLKITSHTGTHMDAPTHMLENGKYLSDFQPVDFFGRAVSIHYVPENAKALADHVRQLISGRPYLKYILFNTGWDQYWKTDKYFRDYPVIPVELIKILAESKLCGIGIDAPSVDEISSTDYQRHNILFNSDKIIIENMTNLNKPGDKEFTLSCFPLNIEQADGSPVRAIGIIDE
ncbi:MAG: cyclase family protein, partial [Calditrichaceae bacterium]